MLTRFIYLFIIIEPENVNIWEYGEIAQNIIAGKGYSLFYFEGDNLNWEFNKGAQPFKSAYMPPGYTILILPAFMFGDKIAAVNIIMAFQLILSAVTCLLLIKLVSKMFDEKAALIAGLIFTCLPEFIYAAGSISPVVIFHLMIVIFFLNIAEASNRRINYALMALAAILIFRMEIILLIILIIIYFLFVKRVRKALILAAFSILILFPWQIRNYIVFNKFIPLTSSGGQNLYRGHNPYEPGVWADSNTVEARLEFKNDPYYEINMNEYYLSHAGKFIIDNPIREIGYSIDKFVSFWLIDFDDKRSYHILYIIPWIIILFSALYGLLNYHKSDRIYYLIYLFYFTSLILIFFALPRYQSMMKIMLLPFSAYAFSLLFIKNK